MPMFSGHIGAAIYSSIKLTIKGLEVLQVIRNRNSIKQYIIRLKEPLCIILLLCVVYSINTYVIKLAYVSGESMYPTLADGDLLLVNQVSNQPSRGDIILIDTSQSSLPGEYAVKRVVALEGDTVILNYESDSVYVNGVRIVESYLNLDQGDPMIEPNGVSTITYQVPTGAVFVLGDNRNDSIDSRSETLGMIERTEIVGVVFLHIPFLRYFS